MGVPPFVPGLELCRRFYAEALRPLLDAHFPGVPHAAALIGHGSDVLGFDDHVSMDHDWGPRLQLFLAETDVAAVPSLPASIEALLAARLPRRFAGFPVGWVDSQDTGVQVMADWLDGEGPLRHRVSVRTLRAFVSGLLGFDILDKPDARDWLTFPTQILRSLTSGAVYYDGTGELSRLRRLLAWYPHDVWLYLLAAAWQRVGQEEHLMPRAGMVGDELGSALIGSRLVRDVMSLCFLMERQYAPYPKWFGTAFRQLACGPDLEAVLLRAQQATSWKDRSAALCTAYEVLSEMHNRLGVTGPLATAVVPFFNRPFSVSQGEVRARALAERIVDPDLRRLARERLIGGVDQLTDNTDLRVDMSRRAALRGLYG